MRHRLVSLATAALLLVPALYCGAAQAHPGHDVMAGFGSGVLHPVGGADHLLAMIAIGLWSALRGRDVSARSMLPLPLMFVTGAAIGTGLGLAGAFDGRIETAVAASLLPLGLALLFGVGGARRPVLGLVGLCGVLHGAAHGRELAGAIDAAAIAGFLLGTMLLHGLGAALALALPTRRRREALAGAGGALAATGAWLLA